LALDFLSMKAEVIMLIGLFLIALIFTFLSSVGTAYTFIFGVTVGAWAVTFLDAVNRER
jgi:hypothetical protein